MKKLLNVFAALCMLISLSAAALDSTKIFFDLQTDKNPLTYEINEPMVFTFAIDLKGEILDAPLKLEWSRAGDDGVNENGVFQFDGTQQHSITTKLGCNGFVYVYAVLKQMDGTPLKTTGNRELYLAGGAGVHPELLTSTPEPEDFDAFWDSQKARLAKVPIVTELIDLRKTPVADIYIARVLCAGPRPVTGILSIPKGAAEGKKYPIRVEFHGYGYAGAPYFQTAPCDGYATSLTSMSMHSALNT